MSNPPTPLDDLRRRLDDVDDRLHDLILERAELVEQVTALKRSSGMPVLRPGREAMILRRLTARHRGRFPRQSLVRLWRELLGGAVGMQGRFAVAVLVAHDRPGLWDVARDHFGSYLPLLPLHSAGEVLSALSDGRAAVGVLPPPSEAEPQPWWPAVTGGGPNGPHVLARLPFGGRGNGRAEDGDAFVIGAGPPDPTGADCTLLVVETEGQMSRMRLIRAFEQTGRKVNFLSAYVPIPGVVWSLLELDDLVLPEDQRLTAARTALGDTAKDVRLFGVYARPLPAEAK